MKGFKGKEMTKMLICRKKAVALGALVVLVGVAGYLNFVYDKSGNGAQSTLTEYVETVKDIENEQENEYKDEFEIAFHPFEILHEFVFHCACS